MPEIHFPCLLDTNKSCVVVDLELPQTKVVDKKTIRQLTARFQLTESQAKFCAGCSRTKSETKKVKQA